jgi:hypothetical protein
MRHVAAVEHVTRQFAAGCCAGTDPGTYLQIVDEHLTPLPDDREWARRHSIGSTARRHSLTLERDQDHTRPAALEPLTDLLARRAAKNRAAAAYAAWAELNGVGLAGQGEHGDLVTETLADDLAQLPTAPGPQRVVLVTRTTDDSGQQVERITQAELWSETDWPDPAA